MRRYEEGYNLYDPVYQKWLETNGLVSTTPNSIVENFSDVPVLNPIPVTDVENVTLSVASAANVSSSVVSTASNISASPSRPTNIPVNEKNNATSNILRKYISPIATKQSSKSTTHAVTTARVLTSKECLDIIKEKQMKKKAEEEEKQRRKQEREEKKKRAEEEKQKKVLEKAQKAAEKAKQQKQRQNDQEKIYCIHKRKCASVNVDQFHFTTW